MRQYIEDGMTVLEPDAGLWLTNGNTYSQKVYLGRNADASAWTETEWDGTYPDDDTPTDEALTRYANELTGKDDQTLEEAAETLILKITKEEK